MIIQSFSILCLISPTFVWQYTLQSLSRIKKCRRYKTSYGGRQQEKQIYPRCQENVHLFASIYKLLLLFLFLFWLARYMQARPACVRTYSFDRLAFAGEETWPARNCHSVLLPMLVVTHRRRKQEALRRRSLLRSWRIFRTIFRSTRSARKYPTISQRVHTGIHVALKFQRARKCLHARYLREVRLPSPCQVYAIQMVPSCQLNHFLMFIWWNWEFISIFWDRLHQLPGEWRGRMMCELQWWSLYIMKHALD